ncbi:hypothetical protein TP2_16960 [Thioclava pacifica DSM 10166]|uniref:FAD:protein FMN transferase n=2 Tax=Thioclava pacifica TaxID=285109 RepID=A0A074JH92_9RHOB|nr:hypothetical protein TP2_16960 [Thioclava pacifica DSM 10166]
MGTRWTALFFASPERDPAPIREALQAAVEEVDAQMSTWKPDSDLMRLNAAALDKWVAVPERLAEVLRLGLEIGKASGGAFDIGLGDAVNAWGFGPEEAAPDRIRAAMSAKRQPAFELLELDDGRARKRGPLVLDLNGIAKGYGVDRLAQTLAEQGIEAGLVGIDGEMRASGLRPDGTPWTIAIESPDPLRRTPHSILALENASVATSGDYRHWIDLGTRRLSHTMDLSRGAPVVTSPASVTVVARSCAEADGWATALMVRGPEAGGELARKIRLDALFLMRENCGQVTSFGTGALF